MKRRWNGYKKNAFDTMDGAVHFKEQSKLESVKFIRKEIKQEIEYIEKKPVETRLDERLAIIRRTICYIETRHSEEQEKVIDELVKDISRIQQHGVLGDTEIINLELAGYLHSIGYEKVKRYEI